MAENTEIAWCDHTVNFWWGCTKVSPACANCYAEGVDSRFHVPKGGLPEERLAPHWGPDAPRLVRLSAATKEAMRYERRAVADGRRFRVFTNSMSDFFEARKDLTLARLEALDVIRQTPHLDWLILTKRPEHILESLRECLVPSYRQERYDLNGWLEAWFAGNPPANVWLGTTVEDQLRADERIPALLRVPAAVRFLSCEPLLGPVDLWTIRNPFFGVDWVISALVCLDWVICGGESGPKARPMHPDWARGLRDQCAAAGVPFLFKQWGEWAPFINEDHYTNGGAERYAHAWVEVSGKLQGLCWIVDDDGTWSNYTGKPHIDSENEISRTVAVMGRHGKKAAGRLLDGVLHDAFPEVPRG